MRAHPTRVKNKISKSGIGLSEAYFWYNLAGYTCEKWKVKSENLAKQLQISYLSILINTIGLSVPFFLYKAAYKCITQIKNLFSVYE